MTEVTLWKAASKQRTLIHFDTKWSLFSLWRLRVGVLYREVSSLFDAHADAITEMPGHGLIPYGPPGDVAECIQADFLFRQLFL